MLINELVTKLTFKMDRGLDLYKKSLADAMRASIGAAEKMEDAHRGAANNTTKYWRDANGKLRDVNGRFVTDTKKSVSGLQTVYKGLFGDILKLTAGFVSFQAASQAASFIFKATSQKETALTQLTTLVGAKKAGGIFKDLQKFAATTPYELNEVLTMFNRLEGAGFKMLDEQGNVRYDKLTKLGDLASASNRPLGELTDTILSANRGLGSMVDNFVGLSAKGEDGALAVEMFDRATGKIMKKVIKQGDKAGLLDFFTGAGERKGISGGMDALAKTLSGQVSTMKDSAKNLATAFSAGFIQNVHKGFDQLIKLMDKSVPQFEKIGKDAGKFVDQMIRLSKEALPMLLPLLEGTVSVLVGMGAAYTYLQALALIKWVNGLVVAWRAMDMAMRVSAVSGALANATIAFIPMLIAAAVAAVAWFGWQVYKYITQGTDSLTWMNENFKWVADSIMFVGELIKTWWPIIEYTAKVIAGVLILAFQGLWTLIQFGWDTIVKPVFDKFVQSLTDIWNWIQSVTTGSEDWNAGIAVLWESWKGFLNWLQPVLSWVNEKVGGIGLNIGNWADALSNLPGFGGGGDSSPAVSGGSVDASGIGFNQSLASKMVQSIRTVQAAAGSCLNAVWRGQQKALGGKSPIQGLHAYQSADYLSKSAQFREITGVTPQMLKDPKFMKMLHGATVIYNRKAGFSQTSGHAEIWDMVTKTAQYGRGNVALNRNSQNLQNARIFIPVSSGGGGGAVNINSLVINVPNTNATPSQIQRSVANGTGQALTKANQQNKKPVPAGGR